VIQGTLLRYATVSEQYGIIAPDRLEKMTMSSDSEHPDHMPPEDDSDVEQTKDSLSDTDEDEEEIPVSVMIVLVILAVGIAVVYLTLGGGHDHFH
jgi:hypothetical protein